LGQSNGKDHTWTIVSKGDGTNHDEDKERIESSLGQTKELCIKKNKS
jgi:hypothetical protein